jgi:TFIIF-interacting CTD phosphatase-like protein
MKGTLEAETVFHTYLASHCSRVTQKSHLAIPEHVMQALQVRIKSESNEKHFTLEARAVFRLYLATHSSGMTET